MNERASERVCRWGLHLTWFGRFIESTRPRSAAGKWRQKSRAGCPFAENDAAALLLWLGLSHRLVSGLSHE